MTSKTPEQQPDTNPAHQAGEENGRIKQPQQTDRTMRDEDLARGSEPSTRDAAR